MSSKIHRLIDLAIVAGLLAAVGVHLLSVSSHGRTTVLVSAALLNALLVSIGVRLMFSVLYGWENIRTPCAIGAIAAAAGVGVLLIGELSGAAVMVLPLDKEISTARVSSKGAIELPFSVRLHNLSSEPAQPVFVLLPQRNQGNDETRRHTRVDPFPDSTLDFGESGRYRIERVLYHADIASYALAEPRRLDVYSHDSLWRTLEITEPGQSIVRPEGDTIVVTAFVDDAGSYQQATGDAPPGKSGNGSPPCAPGIVIEARQGRQSARYLLAADGPHAPLKLDSAAGAPPCPETRLTVSPIASMHVEERPTSLPRTAAVLSPISGGDSIVLMEGCERTERAILPNGDTLRMVASSPMNCQADIEISTGRGSTRLTLTHGELVPHEGTRLSLIGCYPAKGEAVVRLRRSPRGPLGIGAAALIVLGLLLVLTDMVRNRHASRQPHRG